MAVNLDHRENILGTSMTTLAAAYWPSLHYHIEMSSLILCGCNAPLPFARIVYETETATARLDQVCCGADALQYVTLLNNNAALIADTRRPAFRISARIRGDRPLQWRAPVLFEPDDNGLRICTRKTWKYTDGVCYWSNLQSYTNRPTTKPGADL